MAVKRKSGRPAKVPGEKGTKEKIFDAAVDLFAERGYERVSIRDIAAAVGIKESSIYKHYANKDEILEKITEYPLARSMEIGPQDVKTEELILSMGLESFMVLAGNLFVEWIEDPRMEKIVRIILLETPHSELVKKSYLTILDTGYTFWETNFALMIKHKLVKPFDPKVLAAEYITFSQGVIVDYFLVRYGSASNSFQEEYGSRIKEHIMLMVNSIKT